MAEDEARARQDGVRSSFPAQTPRPDAGGHEALQRAGSSGAAAARDSDQASGGRATSGRGRLRRSDWQGWRQMPQDDPGAQPNSSELLQLQRMMQPQRRAQQPQHEQQGAVAAPRAPSRPPPAAPQPDAALLYVQSSAELTQQLELMLNPPPPLSVDNLMAWR